MKRLIDQIAYQLTQVEYLVLTRMVFDQYFDQPELPTRLCNNCAATIQTMVKRVLNNAIPQKIYQRSEKKAWDTVQTYRQQHQQVLLTEYFLIYIPQPLDRLLQVAASDHFKGSSLQTTLSTFFTHNQISFKVHALPKTVQNHILAHLKKDTSNLYRYFRQVAASNAVLREEYPESSWFHIME